MKGNLRLNFNVALVSKKKKVKLAFLYSHYISIFSPPLHFDFVTYQ